MKRNYSKNLFSLFLLFVSICYCEEQCNKKTKSISRNNRIFTSIRAIVLTIVFFGCFSTYSQSKINTFLTPSDTINKPKKTGVYIGETVFFGATLIGLNQLWYKDYPQSNFHFINDNNDWMQMDKAGHFFSTYHLGRFGSEMLDWSGASKKEKLIYGSTLGLGFLTTVEVFDGFSQEWGASWGDVVANTSGTLLYVSQELLWNEQRITPKFSFHSTRFADSRPETFGASFNEQILKDYNGQTYWLSFNLHSFIKSKVVPKWLNIAIGYGAENMLYGNNEEASLEMYNQNSYRQFYVSLDIDLAKIQTNSHFLKTLFSVFNTIKIPAPTLQYDDFNGVKAHYIYF